MKKLSEKFTRHKTIKEYWIFFRFRIINTYRDRFHYLTKQLDSSDIDSLMENFDLDPKELFFEDFLKGDESIFYGSKLLLIKQRLQDPTYKCWGILENGQLVYSTWVSLQKLGLPIKSNFYLKETAGLLEDSYCHPIARGRGFHSKMNIFRLLKLYELGKRKAIAIVKEDNTKALKVQTKSGFKDEFSFYIYSIFGIKFTTLKKNDCEDF